MNLMSTALLAQGEVIQIPPPPWVTMDPHSLTLTALGFFAAVVLITFPLIRALARRLEGRRAALDPALAAEMADLRARVAEVDDLRARVADLEDRHVAIHELEERLDFTERLLARQKDTATLPPGGPR